MLQPPNAAELAELTRLQREARYLDAWKVMQNLSPVLEWHTPEALVLGGRLICSLGDWPASNRIHYRARQLAPTDPTVLSFYLYSVEYKHGPFEAMRVLHENRAIAEAAPAGEPQGILWLEEARLRAIFRDFDAAEALMARAQAILAQDPWWWVSRARLFEQQDRYDDALAALDEASRLRPRYRQAIESKAHLLMLMNRDADALAVLREGVAHLQAGNLAQMLAALHGELEQHPEALAALDRVEEWMPCADRRERAWLAARRSDAFRALGNEAAAMEQARLVKFPFHEEVVKRLAEPANSSGRVHLRVPFVRQHHLTCAPATLAAIGSFWQRPVDHLEIARIICYDGTPDHEERNWAETHGWVAREFRVTWESAVALLDRGCPFTLTTVFTRSAHLQAVVGYDARLGLLLIRDPYQRTHGEVFATSFFTASASNGPRGMVLVPPGSAGLLEGMDLPEAALYDHWYRLRRALASHDRAAAQQHADALEAAAPGHRLSWQCRRELAYYDGNMLRQLEAAQALLQLFPDDANLLLEEAQLLRAVGHGKERRERVEALGRRKLPDAQFLREYAEMLVDDARAHRLAHRLLRRVMRRQPVEAGNLRTFANLLWTQQQFAAATEIYRLAACVGDKLEHHWDAFFSASRHTRGTEPCLELMRQRDLRSGNQSSQPVRTLFRCYEALDRTGEGFDALEAALRRRPDDGELLLFAAENYARFARHDRSNQLLATATGRTASSLALRTRARLAEYRGEHRAALGFWRELLALNPVDVAAHQSVARLLATVEGRAVALGFLREACARHPRLVSLRNTLLEWLRGETPEEALALVEQLLEIEPGNAWALREKALILRRHHRAPEALVAAEAALRIEPNSPFSHGVCAFTQLSLGRDDAARRSFETALHLSIGCGYMGSLLEACRDFAERKVAIAFVQDELARQPATDDAAFLNFREAARGIFTPEQLRTSLESLVTAHPASWAAGSALASHLLDQNQIDAALARARETAERFPLVPRVWLGLAAVQSRAGQGAAEIESLQRTLELSPAWGVASRALAAAHERALQLDAAEHALRRAITADPLDTMSHAELANLLWRRERGDEALQLIERALELEPGYDWAWEKLDQWAQVRKQPRRAIELAETINRTRPGDARAWVRIARLQVRQAPDALVSVDRALAIDPRDVDAHDLRAQLLALAERYEEAAVACRPAVFGEAIPHPLLGRAAWIEHKRGHVAVAIERMRALVDAHPDYAWGWGCLTEWCWEANRVNDTIEAARKWSWLVTDNALPQGYLGAALQRSGHRADAKKAYWHALYIAPAYGYGAQTLLQMFAEDRDLEEAARVLRHIETHLSAADAQKAAVLYHVLRRDQTAASAALASLAKVPDEKIFLFEESATAMCEAGWRTTVVDALQPLLAQPGINPAIGRVWVNTWAPLQRWDNLKWLEKIGAPETVRRTVWSTAVEQMGRAGMVWRLRWLRYRKGEWLRANSLTWGSMGYAFLTMRSPRAVISWLSDWQRRTDVESWVLHNLTLAHFSRKDPARALMVVDYALTLKPDGLRNGFLIWRGIERALRGDHAGAADDRAAVPDHLIPQDMAFTAGVFALLQQFETERATSKRDALRTARSRLAELWEKHPGAHGDAALVHLRARALRHIGARAGSWAVRGLSYLPAPGRQYSAPRETQSVGQYGWMIWVGFILLSALARNCSGHY